MGATSAASSPSPEPCPTAPRAPASLALSRSHSLFSHRLRLCDHPLSLSPLQGQSIPTTPIHTTPRCLHGPQLPSHNGISPGFWFPACLPPCSGLTAPGPPSSQHEPPSSPRLNPRPPHHPESACLLQPRPLGSLTSLALDPSKGHVPQRALLPGARPRSGMANLAFSPARVLSSTRRAPSGSCGSSSCPFLTSRAAGDSPLGPTACLLGRTPAPPPAPLLPCPATPALPFSCPARPSPALLC